MRLNIIERTAIRRALYRHFESTARVFLFGSRVDDEMRGGDIDLLIETRLQGKDLILAKLRTMSDIQRSIGDRKIDIVTTSSVHCDNPPPIVQKAKAEGIEI